MGTGRASRGIRQRKGSPCRSGRLRPCGHGMPCRLTGFGTYETSVDVMMSRPRPRMNVAKHQHRRDGDGMLDIMLHEMEGLSLGEKRELICATKAAAAREPGKQADGATPRSCPRCGSSSFIRKGHNADGSQRWLCKGCGRTSSSRSRGLPAASEPDATAWAPFVEAALPGPGLRQCAKTCHACLRTSWSMRMRLCEAMERPLPAFRAGPPVSWQEAAPASASPSRETGQGALPGCRGLPTGTAAPSMRAASPASRPASSAEPMMPETGSAAWPTGEGRRMGP